MTRDGWTTCLLVMVIVRGMFCVLLVVHVTLVMVAIVMADKVIQWEVECLVVK